MSSPRGLIQAKISCQPGAPLLLTKGRWSCEGMMVCSIPLWNTETHTLQQAKTWNIDHLALSDVEIYSSTTNKQLQTEIQPFSTKWGLFHWNITSWPYQHYIVPQSWPGIYKTDQGGETDCCDNDIIHRLCDCFASEQILECIDTA